MHIYLDNCSTTRPREEVVETMVNTMKVEYGNPSSLHRMGFKIEKRVEKARDYIAGFLKVNRDDIYFTSGGTESNNIAIQGIINKYGRFGKHIITTGIEHPSVLNIMRNYEEKGFDINYLRVDNEGLISLESLENSIRDDTILIAIIQVNNEIGSIQPIWEINNILRNKNSSALLHVDGVQAFGKVPIDVNAWGIDTLSFSGHKIYGPKGVGGLYVRKELKLKPMLFGGNQERGLRSGTENVSGIVGFGKAVEIMQNNFHKERDHAYSIKSYFIRRVKETMDGFRINTPDDDKSSPYILNISFEHVKGEVLLHYLEDKGIYVSTASACSSRDAKKSHVLMALGLSDELIDGALRFCFSYEISKEDVDFTIKVLAESIKEIRQITMG